MSETTTAPAVGTICWTECGTRDAATAKKFYSDLIGWSIEDSGMGGMNYNFIKTQDGETIGGLYQMDGPQFEGVPAHWMPYVLVKSVDESAARCTELGGTIKMPPTDIPGMGRFCVISDPTGAVIALYNSV